MSVESDGGPRVKDGDGETRRRRRRRGDPILKGAD